MQKWTWSECPNLVSVDHVFQKKEQDFLWLIPATQS